MNKEKRNRRRGQKAYECIINFFNERITDLRSSIAFDQQEYDDYGLAYAEDVLEIIDMNEDELDDTYIARSRFFKLLDEYPEDYPIHAISDYNYEKANDGADNIIDSMFSTLDRSNINVKVPIKYVEVVTT